MCYCVNFFYTRKKNLSRRTHRRSVRFMAYDIYLDLIQLAFRLDERT